MTEAADGRAKGLTGADFVAMARNGFGDPANAYVHSMAHFRGAVYAGTSRHSMALLKLFPPPVPPGMDPWPVRVPDDVEDLDLHGQLWRLPDRGRTWTKVHQSPDIRGRDGKLVPRDLGYRGMTVFQGASDPAPALYVGSISTVLRGTAARLLRSEDGREFEPVGPPGLGNGQVSTLRAMTGFDGYLYVPPAGEGRTFNSNRASIMMRSADPAKGPWEQACEPGFGDPGNTGVFEVAVFAGHLYAGTFNAVTGYQVWKTPANGAGPTRWTKVVDQGAHRGPRNEIAMSMAVFRGSLYVGSAVQNGGFDRVSKVGPAAAEIIRINPDDSWDLVVGEERRTPQGAKRPVSGSGPGFDNPFAGYFWRMAVHDDWLYVTTFDWGVFLPLAGAPSPLAQTLIDRHGAQELAQRCGGFEMWRSHDGADWQPVTTTGFGNPYNYGGRTLLSTGRGLLVGTANPFAPETPMRSAAGWHYQVNPDGGAEVWLGTVQRTERRAATVSGRSDEGPPMLVTGGTGFLGRPVLDRLVASGRRLRLLAQPGTATGSPREVEVIEADLDDLDAVSEAVTGVDTVLHMAGALPEATLEVLHEVNVAGTESLVEACGAAGVQRFVLMSSTAVYASATEVDQWPLTERAAVGPRRAGPMRGYGWSKVAAERIVDQGAAEHGFETVVIRPATCYGHGSAFARSLVRSALVGPLQLLSPRVLQYLHVEDAARMIEELTLRAPSGTVVHIAGTDALPWPTVQLLVREAAGQVVSGPLPPPISRFVVPYDLSRARGLGLSSTVGLREGLRALAAEVLAESPDRPRARGREAWERIGRDGTAEERAREKQVGTMIVHVQGTGGLADLVRETVPQAGHQLAATVEDAARPVDVVVDVMERGVGDTSAAVTNRAFTTRRLLSSPGLRGGRVVLVSSVLVYAPVPDPDRWPITEVFPRRAHGDRGSRAFGASCIEVEDLMADAVKGRGIEFVVLRPTVLAGSASGSYADAVLADLADTPWAGSLRHRSAGTMQWLDVRDAAEAVLLAVDAPAAAGEVLNLAGDEAFTSEDLARLLTTGQPPTGALKFDTTKAKVLLGWQPRHELADLEAWR